MSDPTVPRCVNCWAPLRRDPDTGEWVNDEVISRPTCMGLPRPHEPMDADELAVWASANT